MTKQKHTGPLTYETLEKNVLLATKVAIYVSRRLNEI